MVKNKIILFELWKTCQNHCWFCADKYMKENKFSVENNLKIYINYLNNLKDLVQIGLVGGELFDNSIEKLNVKDIYLKLLDTIITQYNNKKIGTIYIFTNLIYKNIDKLKNTINILQKGGIKDIDIKISTSFDYIGRFLNHNSLIFWENNLNFLKKNFPKIEINCEMILTNIICKKILNKEIDLNDFRKKYNLSLTLIQPYLGFMFNSKEEMNKVYPDFFLERRIFLKFCKYVIETQQFNIKDIFINSNQTLSTFVIEENFGKSILIESDYKNSCMGRKKEHFGYIDSNKDIFEDILKLIS